ncbi:MAG TPA: hypothetical protein VFS82_04195 [Lysobacter sp.]|nr:hypothetical protein [Lysobacter sp.]
MSRSRLVTAVLAMTAIALASGLLLPDLGRSAAWSVGESVLVFFLAAAAGAWLARDRFIVPALVVWAVFWAVVAWMLHLIAAPVAQSSVGAILQYNWLAIVLSGAATVAGALCGRVLAGGPGGPLFARHRG